MDASEADFVTGVTETGARKGIEYEQARIEKGGWPKARKQSLLRRQYTGKPKRL